MESIATQPALFVPHGAPTFALHPGAAGAAIADLARTLPPARAIVIVSAHWDTALPTVGFAERPQTLHDFSGFAPALYAIQYPACGSREAAEEVVAAIRGSGMAAERAPARGLDHGAWVPLRLMFPQADWPVIPLSIQSRGGPRQAWLLGRALSPLLRRGFLVIASGNVTHNLHEYQRAARDGGPIPDHVRQFPAWLAERLQAVDTAAVLDYRRLAPGAVAAHPSEEHLLPLFVALGAGGDSPRVQRIHAGVDDFVIAMDAYSFAPSGR